MGVADGANVSGSSACENGRCEHMNGYIVAGNILGVVVTLIILIIFREYCSRPVRQEQQAYVQRIRRERQAIVGRLSDVARTEFEDFAIVSVYHWSVWPIQL